ncbi:MAG: TonB-dependent receptor, partial [Acidobacteria bacterium]|nr:TonB-dependent receptor [Acidobacteriota bacterium]
MRMRIVVALILLFLPLRAHAQTVLGSISGLVSDASGAPLPTVRVTVVETETNRKRTAESDSRGEFVIALLPPGDYRLEAELAGYRKHIQKLVLGVNQRIRTDVRLVPGASTEVVVVTARPGLLRTETAGLGAVIENHQVRGLPLDGRNFIELSLLAPGTAPAAPGSAGSVRGDFAININGAREDSNNFLLDGIYNGDPKLGGFGIIPPVDAIFEFEVLTSSYDASFGRNVGGQVNVALKSGTNQFHGSLYEFFRNAAFDARNYFAPGAEPDPQYQRNQFGFVWGGPIRKDRTFFLADYEGRRVREGITRISNVPTELERIGDFSQSSLPGPIDPFTGQSFPDKTIPEERLDPIGVRIAALYPFPNRSAPQQNFVSSPALRDRDDHFDLRLDHSAGERSDFTFRYSFSDRNLFEPFSG